LTIEGHGNPITSKKPERHERGYRKEVAVCSSFRVFRVFRGYRFSLFGAVPFRVTVFFDATQGTVGDTVNLYRRRILPWCIDLALRNQAIGELRASVLAGVSGTVLEVGFGTGLSVRRYPPTVEKLYALGPGIPPFRRVAQRIAAAPFPIEVLPFYPDRPYPLPDRSMDNVTCMFTLCTVPDPHAAVREIFRVLKPGGTFTFLEHGLAESLRLARWQARLSAVWGCFTGGCRLDRDVPRVVAAGGFADIRHERVAARSVPPWMGRLYRGRAQKGRQG
jgi:SAM-dependent methyltransferase